jgi:hypothetical protein
MLRVLSILYFQDLGAPLRVHQDRDDSIPLLVRVRGTALVLVLLPLSASGDRIEFGCDVDFR